MKKDMEVDVNSGIHEQTRITAFQQQVCCDINKIRDECEKENLLQYDKQRQE